MTNEVITREAILNLVPTATSDDLKRYPWKKGTSQEIINAQGNVLYQLDGLNAIGKRINEVMLPLIAQLNGMQVWKSLENCKSLNQLVIGLGLPKSTASGLIKIATICYDSNGIILDTYANFNYNELQVLAQANESERKHMLEWAETMQNFTTKEFKEELNEFRNPTVESTAVEIENSLTTEPKETESAESTESSTTEPKETESAESTESTATPYNGMYRSEDAEKLCKLCYEVIMNKAIELRAHIDSLTKKDIATKLDEIINELGEISK